MQTQTESPSTKAKIAGILAETGRTFASLQASLKGINSPTIVISSAVAGEGKSIFSAGIGIVAARNLSGKVLLIDCHWHAPTLHTFFDIEPQINNTKNSEDVIILCPEHGKFNQSPNNHLAGKGCKYCANNVKSNTVDFIKKGKLVHGDNYDYSLVEYTTVHSPVKIICKSCKKTNLVQPSNHLNGNKCAYCYVGWCHLQRYQENTKLGSQSGIFYKLKFKHKELKFEFIKIGITSMGIKERYRKYKDYTYEIIEEYKCTNLESALMEREFMNSTTKEKFVFPKNIKFKGHTECYQIKD